MTVWRRITGGVNKLDSIRSIWEICKLGVRQAFDMCGTWDRNTLVSGSTKCPFGKSVCSNEPEEGSVEGVDVEVDAHSLQLCIPHETSSRRYLSRNTVFLCKRVNCIEKETATNL